MTEAINGLSYPTEVVERSSFLGFSSVCRRFVSNFAKLARPPSLLMKKGGTTRLELDAFKKEAVLTLKQKLISTPVLALPRAEDKFAIYADAYDFQSLRVTSTAGRRLIGADWILVKNIERSLNAL